MNETGNKPYTCAVAVPPDLLGLIPGLIAQRSVFGASSPTGRRISTLIEQTENGVSPGDTLAELDQLSRDGGEFVYANHARSHSKGAM